MVDLTPSPEISGESTKLSYSPTIVTELAPPSTEQSTIIGAIHGGQNVMVNSVAGSGKTTLALHIAKCNTARSVLLLTYNKRLKEETRAKVVGNLLTNMEVHSYHAMGYKFYADSCFRDNGLRMVVEQDIEPRRAVPNYDIIIVDEAQDMKKVFYAFVHKLLRDMSKSKPLLVIVGDENQCIFKFNEADHRCQFPVHP